MTCYVTIELEKVTKEDGAEYTDEVYVDRIYYDRADRDIMKTLELYYNDNPDEKDEDEILTVDITDEDEVDFEYLFKYGYEYQSPRVEVNFGDVTVDRFFEVCGFPYTVTYECEDCTVGVIKR